MPEGASSAQRSIVRSLHERNLEGKPEAAPTLLPERGSAKSVSSSEAVQRSNTPGKAGILSPPPAEVVKGEESKKALPPRANPWAGITLKRTTDASPGVSNAASARPHGATNGAFQLSNARSSSGAAERGDTRAAAAPLSVSIANRTLPDRPDRASSMLKPNPGETRLWQDKSGKFQTEAAFVALGDDEKVTIHKLNGSKIAIPLALLSDRDVEFVNRRCGRRSHNIPHTGASLLATSAAAKGPSSATSTALSRSHNFVVNGYDWRVFLKNAGLDQEGVVQVGSQLAQKRLDEQWLDRANKATLATDLPSISDSDALLLLQAITRRKLERLEALGRENVLASIKSASPPMMQAQPMNAQPMHAQPMGTRQVYAQPMHLMQSSLQGDCNVGMLQPAFAAPPSQMAYSSIAPLAPVMVPTKAAPQPTPSVKRIPAMQPQNTISSLKIEPQPVYREYTTTFTDAPQGAADSPYYTQQQTTTRYSVRRSTTSGGESWGGGPLQGGGPPGGAYHDQRQQSGTVAGSAGPMHHLNGNAGPMHHSNGSAGQVHYPNGSAWAASHQPQALPVGGYAPQIAVGSAIGLGGSAPMHHQMQHGGAYGPRGHFYAPNGGGYQLQHHGGDARGGAPFPPTHFQQQAAPYGQPQHGQPQHGQPQHGQPPYGQPPYGQPQHGQSSHGPTWNGGGGPGGDKYSVLYTVNPNASAFQPPNHQASSPRPPHFGR